MIENYAKYKTLFPDTCKGTPVTLTDNRLIAHVYGWAPFTEAATGTGCPAKANLLEHTAPAYEANHFREYLRVKQLFDKLNYATLKDSKYSFNPWVVLIHGAKYVNAPNVYAYSVDDAVGNIQAEGAGIIIDVSSTKNLENRNPASPPITINFGLDNGPIKFTHFRICKNEPARNKVVNPKFKSFIISANNPANCPIFFFDNKAPEQLYTFRITQKPPYTFFADQIKAKWSSTTAKPIDCTGNTGTLPFQPTSKTWCCNKTASNGVFAYSTPEPENAHKTLNHFVILHGPERTTTTRDDACSGGQ
jgi:hypothetical protein